MNRRGTVHDSVTVRRRRYDASSSRLSEKLFGPTWFGFSPMRGYLASWFVGVHASYQRSAATFTRGELSVRMRLTLSTFPPCTPCSRPVSSRPRHENVFVRPYVKFGVG